MKLLLTEPFRRRYNRLPAEVQDQVDRKLTLLLSNSRHPSLQVKKMQGVSGIWELRITHGYRLTFQIQGDLYLLRNVGPHDVLRNP
ncbi:MAG: hypothetical protein HYZ93_07135 [Candidatus Omnitrophica bacterium]|nr:hypothetical protein [Candidatus Omnitrophota bacterium]